jgi:preprotein translocase subunit SecD
MCRLLTVRVFAIFSAVGLTAMADDPQAIDPPAIDLLFEVDAKINADPQALANLMYSARLRVEPWGIVEKRRESLRVRVYETKHADAVERALSGGGSFELRILANPRDHAAIIAAASEHKEATVKDGSGKAIARWIAIDKKQAADESNLSGWTTRSRESGELEALVVEDAYQVNGAGLESATASFDSLGKPCVSFRMTKEGAKRMFELTSHNLSDPATDAKRQLAIIVRGSILSAPYINGAMNEASEISGNFTAEEAQAIAIGMAGAMPPLPLKLIRRELAKPRMQRRRSTPPPALSANDVPYSAVAGVLPKRDGTWSCFAG